MKTKQIVYLPIKSVIPDPNQPRQYFDATKLATLANSIKRIGIREPLVVEDMKDGTYKLIDGERRYRSAKIAGLTEVPTLIEEPMPELDRLVQQFHLQEQHEGWKPSEKAIAIRDMAHAMKLPMKEVAQMLSLSPKQVEEYVAFISLLGHQEMVKSEIPVHFATKLQSLTNYAVKQMLEQENKDMSQDEQKELQVAVIKRIASGELTRPVHILKIRDSIAQDAKKVVHDLLKTNKSVDKLGIETNSNNARLYRTFMNVIQATNRSAVQLSRVSVLTDHLKEEENDVAAIKALIKKLQSLI